VREDKDSTFSEFRPELSYDILHQKGAALSVTAHMLLGWLLTERDRKCVWEGMQREAICVCVCVCVCGISIGKATGWERNMGCMWFLWAGWCCWKKSRL